MRRALACLLVLSFACAKTEHPAPAASPAPKPAPKPTAGNAEAGKAAIDKYGCITCHSIPGIEGPKGLLGPSLEHVASREMISGGRIKNAPETLVKWLQDPPAVDPQTTMPALGVTPQEAQDITAYLQTLK